MLRSQLALVSENHLDIIAAAVVRYCCRLQDAKQLYTVFRVLQPENRIKAKALKKRLDTSGKNELYKAVYYLTQYQQWRARARQIAAYYGIDPDDLICFYSFLTTTERREINNRPLPKKVDDRQVMVIVDFLTGHMRSLVRRRLRYLFENDPSLSEDDLIAELKCRAVELIRHYEVLGYNYLHMIHAVHLGLRNHTSNLVTHHSKKSRSPLQRTQKQQRCRLAWYCDVQDEELYQVLVPFHKKFRKKQYILVRFTDDTQRYVHFRRLYATEEEAAVALARYWQKLPSQRKVLLDLSPTYWDEFRPTTASLNKTSKTKDDEMYRSLEQRLAAPATIEMDGLYELLTSYPDEQINQFFTLILDGPTQLFQEYCATQGQDVAQLTIHSFNTMAKRYTNLSTQDLIQILADTPASIWSPRALELFDKKDLL